MELSNRKCTDDKSVLLLHYFLACNIDFETINNMHCQRLFKALDPSFDFPSITDFQDTLVDTAYQQMQEKNHKSEMRRLIVVQTIECDENLFAISLLVTLENKYIYIKSAYIDKYQDDIQSALEKFCDETVMLVKRLYKINVLFLIYDGQTHLNGMTVVDNIKYFRLRCFSILLKLLKNEHGPLTLTSTDEFTFYKQYCDCLENWQNMFPNSSVAEATEEVLQKMEDNVLKINDKICEIIFSFINAAALGANFLHYKLNGRLFLKEEYFASLMFDFFEEALSDNAFDDFSSYKTKSGDFRRLFESGKDYDPKRLWCIAKMHCKSDLCDFATEMLSIPAIPKKIDLKKVLKIKENKFSDKNNALEALLIAVMLEE